MLTPTNLANSDFDGYINSRHHLKTLNSLCQWVYGQLYMNVVKQNDRLNDYSLL